MEPLMNLLLVLVGLAGGAIMAGFLLKGQARPGLAEADADFAALKTRLQERDATITELRHNLDTERHNSARLNQQIIEEVTLRAAAEERISIVPRLEAEIAEKDSTISNLIEEAAGLKVRHASLMTRIDEAEKSHAEKLRALEDAQAKLTDTFRATAAEALAANQKSFLELAKNSLEKATAANEGDVKLRQQALDHLVKPLKDSLDKVDQRILDLEKERAAAYAGLTEQVKTLADTHSRLQSETSNLVRALRAPDTRGRWGEMQLRRVVEMAGMLEYCDFVEQPQLNDADGARLRPDLIVRLPNNRQIVVDAKVPLKAFLVSLDISSDEARRAKLVEHAQHVRAHLTRLASKAYWDQLSTTPDFVVAFLPGEALFSSALQADPELIEYGVGNRVLLATPTTLIALLKAVAYGWRQDSVARNAQEISDLGKQLYERIANLASHFDDLRRSLEKSVDSYNRAAGSLESRVLVSARRFKELAATASDDLPSTSPVDRVPRPVLLPAEPEPAAPPAPQVAVPAAAPVAAATAAPALETLALATGIELVLDDTALETPAAEALAEPLSEPASEHDAGAAGDPVADQANQPAAEAETVSESAPEPVVEPQPEAAAPPAPESVVVAQPEAAAEPSPAPAEVAGPGAVPDTVPEPPAAAAAAPAAETTQPAAEPQPEAAAANSIVHTIVEPASESASEPAPTAAPIPAPAAQPELVVETASAVVNLLESVVQATNDMEPTPRPALHAPPPPQPTTEVVLVSDGHAELRPTATALAD